MIAGKNDTKRQIQDVAERLIIQGGYNAFSFRDISEEIGIKSASVHYHFPTKASLTSALLARYTLLFSEQLPNPNDDAVNASLLLNGFIDGFKAKVVDQRNMSLCTMLTADKHILPEEVSAELAAFYNVKLAWLTQVFMRLEQVTEDQALVLACQLLASLHGASVLVQATGNAEFFESAVSYWRMAYVK
jgi:TetR/AcrR family transcriptional repressor of nem operon